jgi:hypothetical protein
MAAEMVGCTERALFYALKRDLEFRKKYYQSKNATEFVCLKTLHPAAHDPKNWFAAQSLMKSLHPERYARRADTIPVKHIRHVMSELVKQSALPLPTRRAEKKSATLCIR